MMSLVTVSPVITAFHSYLSHHVFWASKLLAGRIWNRYLLTLLTWNHRDSMPLSAAPRAPKSNQGWSFWSYKSLSSLPLSGPYRIFVIVFNWNHFEMRFLNLRINFYLLRTFCPHLGSFFVFFNHLKMARGEIWPKRSERRNNTKKQAKKKTTKMRTKSLQ